MNLKNFKRNIFTNVRILNTVLAKGVTVITGNRMLNLRNYDYRSFENDGCHIQFNTTLTKPLSPEGEKREYQWGYSAFNNTVMKFCSTLFCLSVPEENSLIPGFPAN